VRDRPSIWAIGALVGLLLIAAPTGATEPMRASAQTVVTGVGPPSWVRPGLRLSFYGGSASIAESSFQWVEDPAGDWQDPSTGKRYRRTDETGEPNGAGGGDGITQVDILAVDPATVVSSTATYPIDRISSTFGLSSLISGIDRADELAGVYVDPGSLGQVRSQDLGNGFQILRGPYSFAGATYDAVSLVDTDPANYSSWTYDTATGILVASTTRTRGQQSPLAAPGELPPEGNTTLVVSRFLGSRQRDVPGLQGTDPAWTDASPELAYSGTYTLSDPVATGGLTFTHPMTFTVDVGRSDTVWKPFTATGVVDVDGVPQSQQTTGVAGPSGLYWVDPSALVSLVTGEVVDRDPVTGAVTSVSSIDGGSDGTTVTIRSQMPGVGFELRYDESSGALVAFHESLAGIDIDQVLATRP
jgi:hypothetical protein